MVPNETIWAWWSLTTAATTRESGSTFMRMPRVLDYGRADGRSVVVQVSSGCGSGVSHAHLRSRLVQRLGCPDGAGSSGRVEEGFCRKFSLGRLWRMISLCDDSGRGHGGE